MGRRSPASLQPIGGGSRQRAQRLATAPARPSRRPGSECAELSRCVVDWWCRLPLLRRRGTGGGERAELALLLPGRRRSRRGPRPPRKNCAERQLRPRETSGPAPGASLPRWPRGGGVAMATASPAADGGRGRPWEGGLVSWPPAPPLTLPWTWMGPSWGQHPGVGDAERPPRLGPGHACGVRVAARSLCSLGCSPMCSPWVHEPLSNVLVERERGRALQDRPAEVIKGADFFPGIT